ncbi:MAG TPA: Na-translocating system protein MpsB, partial [Planctomycetaceae bacterium]|nr:Na-translocating system protein MpsB [Planctomycetaceae bacterium]
MTTTIQPTSEAPTTDATTEATEELIRRLAELLPLQGPITAFAFLNPLQGMEDQPCIEALRQVGDIFGCEPFLPEGSYREKMAEGRITVDDLTEILAEEQGFDGEQKIAGLIRHASLRLSMLQHSINPGTEHELHWIIAETDALKRFRSEISHDVRERMIDSTRRWVSDGFPVTSTECRTDSPDTLMEIVRDTIPRTLLGGSGTLDENTWETVSLPLLWRILRTRIQL